MPDMKETPFTQSGFITGDMGTPMTMYEVAAGYYVEDLTLEVISLDLSVQMDVHVIFTPSGGTATEKVVSLVPDSIGWSNIFDKINMATGDKITAYTDAQDTVKYTLSGKLR